MGRGTANRGAGSPTWRAGAPVAVAVLVGLVNAGCGSANDADPQQATTGRSAVAGASAPAETPRGEDFPRMTTAQALRTAEKVALVRAGASRVVEGQPGTPFTRTPFTTQATLKGRLPSRFVVQVIGGRLGDVEVESPIRPFAAGRRYIVFLGPDGPVGPSIVPQARFEVRRIDGGDAVTPSPQGIRLLRAGTTRPAALLPEGRRRLDDVLYSIRRALRAGP